MKKTEPEQLGDVLRNILRAEGLTDRLHEAQAVKVWPTVVGPDIEARCGKPVVWKGVMTIFVSSAPLRSELNMSRSIIIRLINEAVGHDTIKEIRFK